MITFQRHEECDCGFVPRFKLSEMKDLTDPLTLAEEGTSVTNKKVMDIVYRSIKIAKIEPGQMGKRQTLFQCQIYWDHC